MGLRGLLSVAAALALGACFLDFEAYDPRLGAGGGGDHAGGDGPGGQGGATTSTASGGTVETGGGGAGGDEPARCGTPALLADDFDDGDPSDAWWTWADPGSTIAETGGAVVVTLAEQAAAWAGFTSARTFDLRDTRFVVEVPVVPNPSTGAVGAITAFLDDDDYVQLAAHGGQIEANQSVGGEWTLRYIGDFDPIAHRFWQLREEAGTFFWEVSADGVDFTPVVSTATATLFPMDLVRLELSGYTDGSETAPGEVHFDDVMGGVSPSIGWCSPSILSDDFEDGVRGPGWHAYASGDASRAETGGQLVLQHGPGTGQVAYYSSQLFDFTGAEAVVEVVEAADQPTSYAFFRLEIDSDHGVEIMVSGGEIRARAEVGGATQTLFATPYDATTHRWWRIVESDREFRWETSPDGATWEALAQAPTAIDVTALEVILGSGLASATTGSDATVFDHYNLPP